MCVADLLLLAATALQTLTDTLLLLRHLSLLHVLLLQLNLLLALLLALELIIGHDDELFRGDLAGQDAATKFSIGLVLEIGEKRSDLLLVVGSLALKLIKGGKLNSDSSCYDVVLGCRRSISQAVVDKANA